MVMATEVSLFKPNPHKTFAWVCEVVGKGAAFMAIHDGHLVGSVGILPNQFRYSDDEYLAEQWLYVVPTHRGSRVLPALIDEVRALSKESGLTALMTVLNPNRKRGAAYAEFATALGFSPVGRVAIFPAG